MKQILFLMLISFKIGLAQNPVQAPPVPTPKTPNAAKATNPTQTEGEGAINKRISIIVGIGPSFITKEIYLDPIVSPTNGFVQLQKASKLKGNITLGIAYTPKTWDIISTTSSIGSNGQIIETQSVEHVQKGWTGSLFINPILLTRLTESQSFFNSPDFGFGFGWRFAGGVSILATTEFFWIRQPRDWFVDQFKGNSSSYTINNEVQKSIDINDNDVFATKPVFTFGLKLCYTFDIIKNFTTTTTTTTSNNITTKSTLSNSP